jgi:cell division protein FtsL
MSRSKKSNSMMSDFSAEELTAAFMLVLDNDNVITKLTTSLSVSINLIFSEKINPLIVKLDNAIAENKSLQNKVNKVEQDNDKLKQDSKIQQAAIDQLTLKINSLEQLARKTNIVISGVSESYAERASFAADPDALPQPDTSRVDTIALTCAVLKDACKITVTPADILSATRLQSKRDGPRPLLVSFHSTALRTAVIRARQPKQKLLFCGSTIYINDHLTKFNSDLAFKARLAVKEKKAHSTWTHNGLVYIKWSATSRPVQIQKFADFQ